jgi:hypothetical protein
MIKLSLMTSHHILNDYCSKQLVHNDFRAIDQFCPLWL